MCVWKQLVYLRDTCAGAVTKMVFKAADLIGTRGELPQITSFNSSKSEDW